MSTNTQFERISVLGLGYIGLPTAAVFASRGVEVVGVDINQRAVETINAGRVHIVEPDLDIVVQAAVNTGKLRATQVPEPADAFLIAVPTPFRETPEGHSREPDLTYIRAAAESIAPMLQKGNLVVLESTSPVGTTEQLSQWLQQARPDLTFPHVCGDAADVRVAHCPERVLPGKVLQELVSNDRIIGGLSPACSAAAVELYKIFVKGECILTNARTAEMTKLTENAFRDVNIAFANELSVICDQLKINVWELVRLANRHPRVNILNPGPGVGGHCIAVDPWFIVSSCPDQARLMSQARAVNDSKPAFVVDKVRKVAEQFKEPIIACLGLSFKADIDDLRESPAMRIVETLAESCFGDVVAVEPNIKELPGSLSDKGVRLVDLTTALENANVVVVLVDHREFRNLDPSLFAAKAAIDTRGVFA
ncbi:UDP-N-acetyl-D-mannosamine dehydrogenase [Microbulbifer flavimaris]|uniref:UDP-N-acetyl-D-mannosamine dehydrogenase n=1 Tax=Microbulbifer flavimaris TaxID=1781068 RepID=A0ABX4HX22_9GAMM|nr:MULTISPECIES: UDP-N-acetyl-D-mannosamine dehydrogenase [Microbulbifer]KUJ81447.1 UDP-N-acetyl-D-mannosaminuronic acid dehydrogenase [Microbulbifer sp. ZGT114]PCO04358.1 UDP-N-acetyl-D-mannosamine dehydrogenase [Microbulbifer flavimaris]